MSRATKIALAVLLAGVAAGAIYFRGLHERILRLAQPERSEQLAHREVTQAPMASPGDARSRVPIFWATPDGALEAVEVELALSADPAQRAKQLIEELISSPPSEEQRTLPAEASLLEFYYLPDGTAVADFSGALATVTPSGIETEQRAVDSILRTLEANVPEIRRVKILIQGQETETLAGHVDLMRFFEFVGARAPLEAAAPARSPAGELTPSGAPGKLNR